jgi:hypothetical protein
MSNYDYILYEADLIGKLITSTINDSNSKLYNGIAEVLANANNEENLYFKYKVNFDTVHVLPVLSILNNEFYKIRPTDIMIGSKFSAEFDTKSLLSDSELDDLKREITSTYKNIKVESLTSQKNKLKLVVSYEYNIPEVLSHICASISDIYSDSDVFIRGNNIEVKFQ